MREAVGEGSCEWNDASTLRRPALSRGTPESALRHAAGFWVVRVVLGHFLAMFQPRCASRIASLVAASQIALSTVTTFAHRHCTPTKIEVLSSLETYCVLSTNNPTLPPPQ